MKLHLIRHGQTQWNADRRVQGQLESELNDTGRQQAESRRVTIEALDIEAVYSSSSTRTRQTTAIMCANLSVPVSFHDSLREIQLGQWQGRYWDDVALSHPEQVALFNDRPHLFKLDGAETAQELQLRGVAAVEHIVTCEDGKDNVLVVSHGFLIGTILTHYAGVDLARIWENRLSNCAHSIIDFTDRSRAQVQTVDGEPLANTSWS